MHTGSSFESSEKTSVNYDGSWLSLNTELDKVINLPQLVLSGYGRANHWGGAISTYNINHNILYNGIDAMRAAWNEAVFQANRPFHISDFDKGGLQEVNILAVPYMLVEAGVTEGLMRLGMDGNNAHSTAQIATFLYAMKAPQGVSGEMGIINKGAIRIDTKNLPKTITNDFTEILAGRGTPRLDEAGLQKTVQFNSKWKGALEWEIKDVPGTVGLNSSRIVQHPNGTWGLVINHNYKNIIQLPTSSAVKWK